MTNNADFMHWHCHTEYSAFDGLSKISKIEVGDADYNLALKARKLGFPGLAITDHGVVSGWIKFIKACLATKDKDGKEIPWKPIVPVLGEEFYLARKHEWKSKEFQPDGRSGNRHLTVYAKNWIGFQNLCTLSEKSWVDGFYHSPRIDIDLLEQHSEGLLVGSACLSSVINSNLLYGKYEQAKKAASMFKDIFKEDFFLEVMYHGINEEKYIIPDIFKLSVDLDIPVLATNDCHYINKEDSKSQEVLMCMSTSNCLSNPKHIQFPYGEFYLKDMNEMHKIFGHVDACLLNTVAMLERIDTNDIKNNLFGGMKLPKFPLPQGFHNSFEYLKHLAHQGMKKLGWDKSEKHVRQLNIEIEDVRVALDVNNYDFATYFLIVWDYVNWAKKEGITSGCGRGSCYASVLLHCVGVCYGMDPLKYGLIWERFLGFDTKVFISEKDFGIGNKEVQIEISAEEVEEDVIEMEYE